MALVLADRVLETTPVAGTGDANLSGAVTGYQPFSTIGGGNTTYYTIVAIDDNGAPTGDWEVGIGTYVTSGNKLTRDTVLSSSNGGAKVYFASGTKQIFLDLPSEEVLLTAGNVYGPASAVNSNFALFDGTTGKLIKDAGINASTFATAAQGAKADTAVQPGSLGSAAYLTAGAANGVATLDSGGKVPVSQIPALGDLNYQGTWNASTNTPTLVSSSGTKGYYYVVSVAGSTNLNGITDWNIGDWAVYNGSVWQKIDNTDSVTSVNGYTGTVVLTYTDVGAFPATSTTGSGNVVLATGATQANPTISNYETFTPSSAPSYAEGELWYDNTQKALTYFNDVTNNQVHIGQEVQLKVINNTGSSIANGTPVYVTGTSSGQSYPNIALAKADTASTSAVLGLTNGTIASGAVGYVCTSGLLTPCNTGSFSVGQVLYLSPYSAGQMMNTVPPTGYAVQIGVVAYANTPNGSIYVKQTTPLAVSASTIVGQVAVANGGTGAATLTGYVKGSGTSAMTASSTIPTTDLSGTITNAQLANSSITINGTATSLGGSISVGTVTSVSGTAPIASTGGATPTISISQATTSTNGYLSSTDWNTFNNKQPAGTYVTAVTVVSANGFTGTSSGGATPALTLGTSITGLLKGNGTAISAATSGTDYAPATSGSSILYGNGAGGFSNVTVGTGLSFSAGTLSSSGVTSISFGSTGLTPSTSTTGAVTVAGTLAVANGGTGSTSLSTITVGTASTANALNTSNSYTVAGLTNTGNETISGTLGVTGQITATAGINTPNTFGFKNRLINGAMVIDQRNAGASVTPTTDQTYTVDRWQVLISQASKLSVQQQTSVVPAGFTNAVKITSLAATSLGASDYFCYAQFIEGYNIADLGWGAVGASTVTLSFWVRSSLTGTFGGNVSNGGQSRAYPFTYTISAANTWEQKTVTITGDTTGTWLTTNGRGIWLQIGLGVGTTYSGTAGSWQGAVLLGATGATSVVGTNGATFYITGVQLEKGTTATSFDYRPYTTEFILCQRYYQTYQKPEGRGVMNGIANLGRVGLPLQVQMRSAPTLNISGTIDWFDGVGTGTITALNATYTTINSIEFDAIAATGTTVVGRPSVLYNGSNTGSLTANAEL